MQALIGGFGYGSRRGACNESTKSCVRAEGLLPNSDTMMVVAKPASSPNTPAARLLMLSQPTLEARGFAALAGTSASQLGSASTCATFINGCPLAGFDSDD